MAANIFVDIASENEMLEQNVVSLSEIFRQYFNKNSDADIHTKPAVVLIEDDLMKIFSSKATFEFDATTSEVSYTVWKTERDETAIFEKCFGSNLRYIAKNYRRNSAPVILSLTTIFMTLLADGTDGLSEMVQTISKGRFDYDKNKQGDWRFWYRKDNGEWVRSSLCLFTDFLYNITRSFIKYENSDEYLGKRLSDKKNYHIGYMFIGYANYLAAMQSD